MKKLFISVLAFATFQVSAQVSTMPHSIGIGQSTLSSIPLHINKNGEVARFQGASPYISFYEGGNWNGFVQAFNNSLSIGTKNSFDLNMYTDDIARFTINGVTGQATVHQRFNVLNGINLTGPLRVAGNNVGTSGDVLMSLGNTTPAWATVQFNPQIGFQASFPSSFSIPFNTATFLTAFVENFDDGNNFTNFTGTFTVPSTGLYYFGFKVKITKLNISDANINDGAFIIDLNLNGTDFIRSTHTFKDIGGNIPHIIWNETVKLQATDIIRFKVSQINENSNTVKLFANGSTADPLFTCYKIY